MKKSIFDEEIYEDLDLYKYIKKDSNIINENAINQIYLLKININKENGYINIINAEISFLKSNFIINTKKWTLEDSCNKKTLENKINEIFTTYDTIYDLIQKKNNHIKNISELNNKINTIINNNRISNKSKNKKFDDEEYDEINSIINC
tara:strand:- start:718 stop:1164 length:447 start_codon:yes stop_codon:yes gene_type:complete